MDKYLLTKQEMEQLAWDAVQLYRTGAHSESRVLPKNKARSFKRLVVREYLDTRTPKTVNTATTLGELV